MSDSEAKNTGREELTGRTENTFIRSRISGLPDFQAWSAVQAVWPELLCVNEQGLISPKIVLVVFRDLVGAVMYCSWQNSFII